MSYGYTKIVWANDDGTFGGKVVELPGCLTDSWGSPGEAADMLSEAMVGWLEVAEEDGQTIPPMPKTKAESFANILMEHVDWTDLMIDAPGDVDVPSLERELRADLALYVNWNTEFVFMDGQMVDEEGADLMESYFDNLYIWEQRDTIPWRE